MSELGRVVYNICNIVAGGIVCFFPSYEYESTVHAHWEQAGFIQKMTVKKKVIKFVSCKFSKIKKCQKNLSWSQRLRILIFILVDKI